MQISEVLHGERGVSSNKAMRLSRYLGITLEFWPNIQSGWELSVVEQKRAGDYQSIGPYLARQSSRR